MQATAHGLTVATFALASVSARIVYEAGELKLRDPDEVGSVVLSPLPHTYLESSDLPAEWNPHDIDGITLVTSDLNQHIPKYCGSCWAHAPMSSLADRIKIASKGKGREVIPSIQDLINCGDAGNCQGGDPNAANAWVHKSGGVPDVTCQQYQAKNMNCTAENRCQNCAGANCYGVPNNLIPMIQVEEYGSVRGDDKIMAEIFARGPVSCTIDASVLGWVLASGNTGYTTGIANYTTTPRLDHAIQIAGWGVENGVEYWLGRNSWGTYWGEHGWFRIARKPSSAAAAIAAGDLVPYEPGTCYWATPKYAGTGPGATLRGNEL